MIDSTTSTPNIAPSLNPWVEVAGIGVAVIEASWLVLLFQSLSEATAGASTIAVFAYFALVFWGGYQLVRSFMAWRLMQNMARALLIATYALLTWLAIRLLLPVRAPADFNPFTSALGSFGEVARLVPAWLWLAGALLWLFLRGAGAARQGVGTFAVQRYFKVGVAMFLAQSALSSSALSDLPGLAIFLVFLFATLMAMAAARVSILGRLRGGRRNPFTRAWFGGLSGAVAGTVAAAFTASLLATGRFISIYRQILSGAFVLAVALTLSPFLFILGLFAGTTVNPIQVTALPEGDPVVVAPAAPNDNSWVIEQLTAVSPNYRNIYYAVLATLGVLLVIGLFFGVRTMTRRRAMAEQIETIEHGDLLSLLRELYENRRNRLRDAMLGARTLDRGQRILAAARIRRIYTELADLAQDFGSPRDPAQTPLEYLAVLQDALPAEREGLKQITGAYLRIRYGELPERADEVQSVESAWGRVKAAGEASAKAYEAKMKAEAEDWKRKEKTA